MNGLLEVKHGVARGWQPAEGIEEEVSMRYASSSLTLIIWATLSGCGDSSAKPDAAPPACDSEPVILTTDAGVEFVRTPDTCFDSLPEWPYDAEYVEIEGLRQAYVDEGPADGPVVLLLHGQPSWSYLYRKMIPVLAEAGFRVIAMDHLGMGRSDKPVDINYYSYLGHIERLERFIQALGLSEINLFCQDWGSLIGLHVVGLHPEWFAHVAVGDGALPVIPEEVQPYPPVEDPDTIADVTPPFVDIPPQQPAFYDGCDLLAELDDYFGEWMIYAMTGRDFRPSVVVEAMTWFDLPEAEEAAYDAPFPSRVYMAGPRVFPSLVNDLPGVNDAAWAGLTSFDKPFLTIWAANDPGNLGRCTTQENLTTNVPGAAGWPHTRLPKASHFLQDDQGPEIARRLVGFYGDEIVPLTRASRYCEVLIARQDGELITADVWGTQYLNDCPPSAWEALDAEAIETETGALAVVMNGPRIWLPDLVIGEGGDGGEQRTFGELLTSLVATVSVTPGQAGTPYQTATVARTTLYTFDAGVEIYELTDPDDDVYVMQAMSQIVDPDLSLADLPTLGTRLALPTGWSYDSRTLEAPLLLRTNGEAVVLQDELQNTYQQLSPDDSGTTLPVLPDGTGTPCPDGTECAELEASHCLVSSYGSFCTVEGCASGGCGAPYVCCHSCNEDFASFLPFEGSACIPEQGTSLLTGTAGCTCD